MRQLKFLLATDYSKAVMNAERFAIQLAKATGSTLDLLHVYQTPVALPSQPVEYAQSAEEFRRSHQEQLEHHRNDLFHSLHIDPSDLPGECIVREGRTGQEVCDEAETNDADFIIIGTHGASGFRETFLGSHSWDVMRSSNIPVLVIPEDALFKGIEKIVFGTSYRDEEIPLLGFLMHFCGKFNASLTILHVTNYALSKEFEKQLFEKFRSKVEDMFSYPKLEVRLLIKDDVVAGLDNYCMDNKVDVLAMSVPKTSFLEKIFMPNLSLTRKMSFHSHIPLLIIPATFNHTEYLGQEIYFGNLKTQQ